MQLIDTHCHLFWNQFEHDLPAVLADARTAGVDAFIIPATSIDTFRQSLELYKRYPGLHLAAGIHPHDTAETGPDDFAELAECARMEGVCAIGEIGLDYYYDYSPKERQQAALHAQLELALELQLPVIIHNRESDEDVLAICLEHQDGSLNGQFHCFSSSPEYAERVLDAGFHISFTGNVTFRKTNLDDVLKVVPDSRLLIETDAPFMTPVPHRGKRNEPKYLPLIAEHFAAVRGTTAERIAEITTANAIELFNLPRSTCAHD